MRQISVVSQLELQSRSVVGQPHAALLNPWMITDGGVQ